MSVEREYGQTYELKLGPRPETAANAVIIACTSTHCTAFWYQLVQHHAHNAAQRSTLACTCAKESYCLPVI